MVVCYNITARTSGCETNFSSFPSTSRCRTASTSSACTQARTSTESGDFWCSQAFENKAKGCPLYCWRFRIPDILPFLNNLSFSGSETILSESFCTATSIYNSEVKLILHLQLCSEKRKRNPPASGPCQDTLAQAGGVDSQWTGLSA